MERKEFKKTKRESTLYGIRSSNKFTCVMLGESQIRHYYLKGFKEPSTTENWPNIWRTMSPGANSEMAKTTTETNSIVKTKNTKRRVRNLAIITPF